MADTMKLTVHPFRMGTDKEAALKPLEEAAEAYASWQILDDAVTSGEDDGFTREYIEGERGMLADEIADCITACCNLAARYDLDLQAAIERVERHNRERGRY